MSELQHRITSVASLRLWAARNAAVLGRLRIRSLGTPRWSETLTRIRDTASLLGPAARGAARLVMERALAAPRRVAIGAGVAALVAGIGAAALLVQHGRHAGSLAAAASNGSPPDAASAALSVGTAEPLAAHASPAPVPAPGAGSAAPPAAGESPLVQGSAPDITSSIGSRAQDRQHQSSAPPALDGGRRADQIGALLRGKPVDDGSRLVREAQIALAKLGYAVKPDGAEDGATRRALRHFERAHGLAPTIEINPDLVQQLTAAARP